MAERVKRSRKAAILACLLILIVLVSSSYYLARSMNAPPQEVEVRLDWRHKINTVLKVQVFGPDGSLKDTRVKEDDLLLTNFKTFLSEVFEGDLNGVSNIAVLKDTAGANDNIYTRSSGATIINSYGDSSSGVGAKGGIIGIGIGTTAPALADFTLESQKEAYTATTSTAWNSASGNVTITSTIPNTAGYDVTEAVLGCVWVDGAGTPRTILLFRDTFAAITVANLDTTVITYVIQLTSVEFNDNFGNYLKALFTTVADGGTVTASCKDLLNNVDNVNMYVTSATNIGFSVQSNSVVIPNAREYIGTDNTAPTRTQVALIAAVETAMVPAPDPYIDSGDLVVRSDVICLAARSVQEAAFVYGVTTCADTSSYMFWRDTFAVVNIPINNSIRIIFVIDL